MENMKTTLLKLLFAALSLFMIYTTIITSMKSSLFEEWSTLGNIPWMKATLIDFYINIAVLWAWVVYKERSWPVRLVWLVLFVGLGSITVTLYVVLQLMKLRTGDSFDKVLLRNEGARS
jgi:hypothetical protein